MRKPPSCEYCSQSFENLTSRETCSSHLGNMTSHRLRSLSLRTGKEIGKVFFGILFAGLGGLANLLTNDLPLVVFVVLDCVEKRLAFVLGKFGVMHILLASMLVIVFQVRIDR